MLIKCDALRLEHISQAGRTTPLVIECEYSEENIPIRKTYLVKAIGLPQIQPAGLYCDLLGNLLAREFGIRTPTPVLVNLEADFLEVNKKVLWERNIRIKPGLGIGCEYFSQGFTPVKSDMFLSNEQFEQAVMIYGFDLLSQNPDRIESNPNCAVKGDKIIAFDFDQCLSFIYPILGRKTEAWELSKLNFEKSHVFYSNLKAKRIEIDWQPVIKKLKQINKDTLEKLCSVIPAEFGNYTDKVCNHFLSIIDKVNQVKFELTRSLL